jgi:hypothetical protein
MSDITHYEGCWQDPRHHACALTEIDRLREVLQKEIVDEVTLAQAAEIERLRQQVTQRGARMQVMREAWRQTDWMQWISYDYPEAREWFDDDGVPR